MLPTNDANNTTDQEHNIGLASDGQRLLWSFERRLGNSSALNIPIVVRLKHELNEKAFEMAIYEVVSRHETLRTRIVWTAPKLTRVISDSWRPKLKMVNCASSSDPKATLEKELKSEITTPIASTNWPIRATVYSLSASDHVICLNIHHMAVDAISNGIILQELGLIYQRECGMQTPPLADAGWQYSQWVEWEASQLKETQRNRHIKYWQKQLEGATGPKFLQPHKTPGETQRLTGHESSVIMSSTFDRMEKLATQERTTLFSIILAVFNATTYHLTNQTDITITTLLSDRIRPQIISTVGYFVSTIALRTQFAEHNTFIDLVQASRDTLFGAIKHQAIPLHMLPRKPAAGGENRIDDTVLQMMGDPANLPKPFEPWDMYADYGGGRTFDLELVVQPVLNSWYISALYCKQRFSKAFIRNLTASFSEIAQLVMENPHTPIANIKNHKKGTENSPLTEE